MPIEAPAAQTYQSMRPYLFAVAYRMTGSASDAEDLVQDAWLRYLDAGSPDVTSLRAYLTTIVSRLALDHLKSARVKREQYLGPWMAEPVLTSETMPGPAETVEQREEVSIAFLTLLERLKPEQRVVYVLREAFDLSHEEISEHLDKSAAACRQIFHRAQLRLSTERRPAISPSRDDVHHIVDRFLAAFTAGNVARVAELLAPDVEWTTDAGAHRLAVRRVVTGADNVARGVAGYSRKWAMHAEFEFEVVDLNGSPSIVWRYHGKLERVTVLDIVDGRITCVRNLMNPEKLRHLAASLGREVVTTGDLPFLVTRNSS